MAQERSSMKNFFAAMGAQMMGGYGAKTISTPMGSFQWDDNLQVWVNINNGMQMNNIAFQDAMSTMDYNTESGDQSQAISCIYTIEQGGNITIDILDDNFTYTEFPNNALNSSITCATTITVADGTFASPQDVITMEYATNALSTNWAVWDWAVSKQLTLPAGTQYLKFRAKTALASGPYGYFFINNVSKNGEQILRVDVTVSTPP